MSDALLPANVGHLCPTYSKTPRASFSKKS